jgi:hypothetical protein
LDSVLKSLPDTPWQWCGAAATIAARQSGPLRFRFLKK